MYMMCRNLYEVVSQMYKENFIQKDVWAIYEIIA